MRPRAACVLAACVLAATPSAALAQGAGDDQYVDPFAGEAPAPAATATPAPTAVAPSAPPAPSAPQAAAPTAGQAPAPVTSEPVSAEPVAQAQLPYTGADAGLVGAAGAALLAGGIVLRVRLRAGA